MDSRTLGEAIRERRTSVGISLRDLARQIEVSAPFLSDVELGRRFPSDEVLNSIARVLKIDVSELEQYDHRESVAEFKRLVEGNPALGMAFRSALADVRKGRLSSAALAKRIEGNFD